MQGQDANGDQRDGRDFRHQTGPKDLRSLRLQELAQPSIVSGVKGIVALLTVAGSLSIAACSFFEPGEAVREESGRTLYRAAEENPTDRPDVTPLREKVPGEAR